MSLDDQHIDRPRLNLDLAAKCCHDLHAGFFKPAPLFFIPRRDEGLENFNIPSTSFGDQVLNHRVDFVFVVIMSHHVQDRLMGAAPARSRCQSAES